MRRGIVSAFALTAFVAAAAWVAEWAVPPLGIVHAQPGVPNPDFADAVWVGRGASAVRVSAGTGDVEFTVDDGLAVEALAVDELAGRVWLFGDDTLRALTFRGVALLAVPVGLGDEKAPPRLAAHAGSVWLGAGDVLYRFDAGGALTSTLPLPGEVRDLDVDAASGVVWAATARGAVAFDADAAQVGFVDTDRSGAWAVAVDRASGAVWLATQDAVERYSADGVRELEVAAKNPRHVAADGAGGVWAATQQALFRFDAGGQTVVALDPLRLPGNVVGLASHVVDPSVWVATQQRLLLVAGSGNAIREVRFNGGGSTTDLALYTDLIAPQLAFRAPAEGAVVTDPRPAIEVDWSDAGRGVDGASLRITANGAELAVSCAVGVAAAVCEPLAELPEGEVTLAATVADFAGNLSAPAAVTFTVAAQNLPPVLAPIGDRMVAAGSTLEVQLEADDPNGDVLTFQAAPLLLPAGARLDTATGLFTFTPPAEEAGDHAVTFSVSDGRESDSETVTITVFGPMPGMPSAVTGRLLDTGDFLLGVETPIVGATVSVGGSTVISDAAGRFLAMGVASGMQVLFIDCTTAAPAPDGSPYASFAEAIEIQPGLTLDITRPIFLPRVDATSLTTVDPAATTVVTNPGLAVSVTVPPATAKLPDGSDFTGQLSVSEVPQSLAPVNLPEELDPALLLTLQPVGVSFTTPVPLTVPNLDGMPPGSELDLWSVDPTTGRFEIVGVGRVSADGSVIETVSGGIRTASWHTLMGPQPGSNGDDNNGDNRDPDKCDDCNSGSLTALASGNLSVVHDLPPYFSLNRPRGLRLVYNSGTADPRPTVKSRTTIPVRAAVPPQVSASLEIGGLDLGPQLFTDTAGLSESRDETILQAAQVDASELSTGSYDFRLRLTSHYPRSSISSFQRGNVLVNNLRASPIGAGWGISGLERLHVQRDDSVVLADGDGEVKAFRPAAFRRDVPDFSDLADFVLNGQAATLGNPVGGNVLRLTTAAGNQRGSAFFAFPITLEANGERLSFSTRFQVRISNPVGGGADGLVFVLTDGPNRLGGLGGSIGYGGISPSVGVELDTWNNGGIDGNSDNHLGINVNGNLSSIARGNPGVVLENGLPKTVWIDYDGTSARLEVRISETEERPAAPQVAATVDLPGVLGSQAFLGWTAGTGGAAANHDVLAWSFESSGGGSDFASPPGDFSVLSRETAGGFTRTLKDGSVHRFDAGGRKVAAVDVTGAVTAYAYDSLGRLVSVTDPVGLVTTLDYAGGLLASITDPAGRVTSLTHDEAGNLVRVTDADGTAREFVYDARHRLVTQRSKRGFETTYAYDSAGRNVRVVRPDGSERRIFPKDAFGLADALSGLGDTKALAAPVVRPEDALARYVDGNGNTTVFDTDRFGAATRTVDASGRVTTAARDANGNPTRVVNSNGLVQDIAFDERGNLLSLRQTGGGGEGTQEIRFDYQAESHLVTRITDPLGHLLEIDYDAAGNPTAVTDPLGGVSSATYNSFGQTVTSTDPNGHVMNFGYDANGNTETITDPRGVVTRLSRDAAGRVTAIVEAEGLPEERLTTFTYDLQNRLLTSVDPTGGTTRWVYDAAGNAVEIVAATGEVVRGVFDAENRLLQQEHPVRGTTRFTYDANGNVTEEIDAGGARTEIEYDEKNRPVRIVDALGGEQTFGYDPRGNLLTYRNPAGQAWAAVHDSFDRVIRQTDPLGRSSTFAYDGRSFLASAVNPRGQTLTFAYDALGRLTTTQTPDNLISRTYDAAGNVTALDDSDSSLRFAFDELGRVVRSEVVDVGTQPGVVTTATYDALGNRVALADSLGGTTLFAYDANSRMTRLTTPAGPAVDLAYDASGRFAGIGLPNGLTTGYAYDGNGRLATLEYRLGSGATLSSFSYVYDALGKLITIAEGARVRELSYDALERLTAGGTAGLPETYTYDSLGRVSSFLSSSYLYDAANQLTEDDAFRYAYDAEGNLTSKTAKATGETTAYAYDAQSQLVRVDRPDGTAVRYRYDGLGRRIEKDVDGALTRYTYDHADLLLEFDGDGALTARYSHGHGADRPLAMERGGASYYYLADHQGSIRFLTDAAGAAVNSYEYDSFGRHLVRNETVPNPYGFTGREFDEETGLYYYRARTYDPLTGRFLRPDPLGLGGGGANFYAYAGYDPVNRNDPSGLLFWDLVDVGFFLWSLKDFIECPSLETGLGLALDTVSLLPVVPSLGWANRADDVLDVVNHADDVGDVLRHADDLGDVANHADDAADALRHGDDVRVPCRCFAEGTEVLTADSEKPIEDLRAGDEVRARDETTGEEELARVIGVFEREVDELLLVDLGDTVLRATPAHRFQVPDKGWTAAADLAAGSRLERAGGGEAVVRSVTRQAGLFTVYDLEVDVLRSFLVSEAGFWVHNCDTLQPGPHAGDSVPARGPERDFTQQERDAINEIGQNSGCHTCGTTDPGTRSGDFIPDHQPPNALNPDGSPQQLYPHCLHCSRRQGGQVRQATRGGGG